MQVPALTWQDILIGALETKMDEFHFDFSAVFIYLRAKGGRGERPEKENNYIFFSLYECL